MKIDVVRPPAPPKPLAEVIIVLTETEARSIHNSITGRTWYGDTYKFAYLLSDAVRAL